MDAQRVVVVINMLRQAEHMAFGLRERDLAMQLYAVRQALKAEWRVP